MAHHKPWHCGCWHPVMCCSTLVFLMRKVNTDVGLEALRKRMLLTASFRIQNRLASLLTGRHCVLLLDHWNELIFCTRQ